MDVTEYRVLVAVLVALGQWVVATPAAAEDAESENERLAREADESLARRKPVVERSFSDRPIHLLANVGGGTLVGNLGLTAGYSVHNRFELGGGIGVNGSGLMGGPYLRARPLVRTRPSGKLEALAVDVGLSVGGYEWREDSLLFSSMSHTPVDELPVYRLERALFLQVELSWEMINADGIMVRVGGGGTHLLNSGDIECVVPPGSGQSCGYSPSLFLVVVGSFGFAL